MKQLRRLACLLLLLLITSQGMSSGAVHSEHRLSPGKVAYSSPAALALSITPGSSLSPLSSPPTVKFEPSLLKDLLTASDGAPSRGIVYMREQPDISHLRLAGMDRLARRTAIVNELQSTAERSQVKIRALLDTAQVKGQVRAYDPLWIVNAIAVEGTLDAFVALASRPEVGIIREDRVHYLPDVQEPVTPADRSLSQQDELQWNVKHITADRAWEALNITGKGSVVAIMDSGVDWQHPYLIDRYRGYTGKPWAVHEGNWFCATDEGYLYPGDGLGHGTHVAGIAIGQSGIGIAPDAQWIAVKVFDNQGAAYDSWIHQGFQWLLAPNGNPSLAPDIVNSSWGSELGGNQVFRPDVQALRTAGILPIFAAGNDGSGPSTVHSPASHPESLAVGAIDRDNVIALFSGRGPSPWGEVKPEVTAPGVDILSTLPGGGFGIKHGTSMATPHVAGLAALLLEADPRLSVDELESLIIRSARPLGEGQPNNDYGWGLVDAYAAVRQARAFGQLSGRVADAQSERPLADAAIEVLSQQAQGATNTDAQGEYTLYLSAGVYQATFSAFGYATSVVRNVVITEGLTSTLDVKLFPQPVGTLQGVVREAGTDIPLGASVYLPGAPPTTTASPDTGAYSLILPRGTHTVRVATPAHRFVTATVTIEAGETTYQDFGLEPAPTILLVDSGAWYNESQRPYYEAALEELGYLYDRHVIVDVYSDPSDVPTPDDLLPYDIVIWSAPRDAPGYIGATSAITTFLSSGGRLLLSGQDVAFWDGGGSGLFYDPYLSDYLKATFLYDDAASRTLIGRGPAFAGMTVTVAGPGGADNQAFPDVIAAADRDYASTGWEYQDNGSGGQVVGSCLPYRAVYLSFGLEAANSPGARSGILQRSIDWLMAPPRSAGVELTGPSAPTIAPPGEHIDHALRLRNTGEVSTDTYKLILSEGAWPTALQAPSTVSLGACHSRTLTVTVAVPEGVAWHTFDAASLMAHSELSPASEAVFSMTTKTPAPILLVDGARFYRMEGPYKRALDRVSVAYDYYRVKENGAITVPANQTLSMYPMVVWYTAYDWFMPLDAEEERQLVTYLEKGGRLFLSSQDYLFYGQGHSLASEYLGVLNYGESISSTLAVGQAKHPIGWGLGPYTLTYPYRNWSDTITPTLGTDVSFRGQHGQPIGLTRTGEAWRAAFWSFPFETLDGPAGKATMGRTVGWLSWLGTSEWTANRRTVSAGDRLTLTAALVNDGWVDIASAHFSTTLPAQLSLADEPFPDMTYDPLTRLVSWHGSIARDQSVILQLRVKVAPDLAPSTYVSIPAHIGYDDHGISFERPYVLRVNGPDLSTSSLSVEPALTAPRRDLNYALTIQNTGIRDTTATVAASPPSHALFTGILDTGQVGSGELLSQTLAWTGPVPVGQEITLRYRATVDSAADGWLIHHAVVTDDLGEEWSFDARAQAQPWKAYLPRVFKRHGS